MSESIPTAIASSTFTIFGVELRCYVLDNGRRIIEAESVHDLLEAMAQPQPTADVSAEMERLARWIRTPPTPGA